MMFYRFGDATASGQVADWDRYGVMGHMFGANNPMTPILGPIFGLVWLTTWVLVMAALISLIRWLWKKGDK